VTLPALLLLLDYWPLGRWRPGRRPGLSGWLPPAPLWAEKLPFFALSAACAAVALLSQERAVAVAPGDALPLPVRAANAAISIVRYVGKTVWPLDLAAYYPHPASLPPWWAWSGALAAAALTTALALRIGRARPWAPVGWHWFLAALVPMLGLVQVGAGRAMADRYTYLPQVGLLVAAVWGSAALGRTPGRRAAAAVAVVAAVLACGALTARQAAVWRTNVGLFAQAAALAPPRGPGRDPSAAWLDNAYGLALSQAGRYAEAAERFQRALAAKPGDAAVLNNLGFALKGLGRGQEAEPLFREAIARDPRQAPARNSLADLLLNRGRTAEAAALLREALAIDPGFVIARNNLGIALALSGAPGDAEREFRAALARDPGFAPAYDNLARVLVETGRPAEAAAVRRARERMAR
jgi:Flp pilus assembly protein TadD